MTKILHFIDNFVEWLVVSLYAGAICAVFLQVILRKFFNSPMMWPEEFARIIFVWLVYMGAPIVIKRKANIEVDYFVQYLSYSTRKILRITFTIVIILFSIFIGYLGWLMIVKYAHMTAYTMPISQAIWYLPIFLGSFMIAVNSIRLIPSILAETEEG